MAAPEPTAALPKIFLSYGRSDAGELARKLTADLRAEGFEVWLDTSKIRAGEDWANQIADGLRSAQIVIALMSPHSVRTKHDAEGTDGVDSVCLSEIKYALFNPPPKPVVPVMAVPCEAPLDIYHLDYVEMSRWNDSDSQYREGLQRLLAFIADARQKKGPRYRKWYHTLQPWDFAAFLHDKRRNFTGREWVFDAIDDWRTSVGVQQVLLITGDPGVGKSAIVAQLVHCNFGGQVIAYHCCQSNTLATLEPWRFVRSIAAMLASRLPVYAQQLDVPAVRDMLTEESCRLDPASAFSRGVLAPLETLPAPEEGVRYILIDALDEALTLSTGLTIVDLLAASIGQLPAWLRIVATTRDEPGVMKHLEGLPSKRLQADDPKNKEDLRQYIRHRLSIDRLQQELQRVGRESKPESTIDGVTDRIVDALVQSSGGIFLYVRYALDEIEAPPNDKGARTFSLDHLDQLPAGLPGMYEKFFQRQFGKKGEQYSEVKPILEVICAAREPLEERILSTAAGLDQFSEFPERWRMVAQYLPARGGDDGENGEKTYAPFHKSLTDWLTDEKTRAKSGFFIQVAEGDRRLAEWCWTKFGNRTKGPPPNVYWVRHGVAHLLRMVDQLHKEQIRDNAPDEKYRDVVRAVEFLGWLNDFPGTKPIVAGALPLLSTTLTQTESDLDSPGKVDAALRGLEDVNQQTLFNLVKDTCATDLAVLAVGWIGRTQLEGWQALIPQMLELNEYVVRYAAGCGQAARYDRLNKDDREKSDAEKKIDVEKEIDALLDSSDMNEQEMGSYAIGEIAKSEIPSTADTEKISPQIARWLQRVSNTDRYFCQSVLGDLLISLTLQDEHARVAELDESGVIAAFWNPIWQYTRLDVISVLALRAIHGQPLGRDISPFQAEVAREVSAIQARERRIEEFQSEAGKKGVDLAAILRQTDLDDTDYDTINSWLTRDGLDSRDPDQRVRTAAEFLRLMFTHPTWQMCEKGSAILPQLGGESEWRDTAMEILDRLIGSLDPLENDTDSANWRVILGTSEACYLTRHFDPDTVLVNGHRIPRRFSSCCRTYFGHSNCHVRALLAEGYFFIVGENDRGQSGWKTGRAAAYLEYITDAVDCWLLDRDVWVLEHVYQLFRIVDKWRSGDPALNAWTDQRFAHVQAHPECLLAQIGAEAGKSWVTMGRAEFLERLQGARRRQPFPT
jgi:hypothetical protein